MTDTRRRLVVAIPTGGKRQRGGVTRVSREGALELTYAQQRP